MQTEVTDSGLILKTAQDRETQFRNRKADRQPQALDLAWNSFWTFSCAICTPIGCEEDPGCHGTFSWMPVPQLPWQTLAATLRTSRRSAKSFDYRWGSGFEGLKSSRVECCLLTAFASTWSPAISSSGQKWPLVVPNVALPDVFQSARVFSSRHILPMNLVTYTIQDCNKNHVCHICSGPCLELKKRLVQEKTLGSQMTGWWFHLLPSTA